MPDKIDVARLAEEAGMIAHIGKRMPVDTYTAGLANLEHFARLVMEECAKWCDEIYHDNYPDAEDDEFSFEAGTIRARMP
jgi:hypothetical protein